jgi:hypothetical protein
MRHAFSGSAARRGAMITELVPLVLRRLDDSLITTSTVPRVNISSTFAAAARQSLAGLAGNKLARFFARAVAQ